MNGLNWQSLAARETPRIEHQPTDTVLLWQAKRPLIFLREDRSLRQLVCNFDPSLSNAEQQPAFIVLLHRFAETLRAAKIAPVATHLETGQALALTTAPGIPLAMTATDPAGTALSPATFLNPQFAIREPGFLTIRQGEQTLLTAAVHFGDPREADFSGCGSSDLQEITTTTAIERHTRPDPLWRVWILVLIAALIVSWKFTAGKSLPVHGH